MSDWESCCFIIDTSQILLLFPPGKRISSGEKETENTTTEQEKEWTL
jgi:hypothetical protein